MGARYPTRSPRRVRPFRGARRRPDGRPAESGGGRATRASTITGPHFNGMRTRPSAVAPSHRHGRGGWGGEGAVGGNPAHPPPQTPAALVDPPWAVTPQRRRGRLDGPRPSRPLPVAGAARVYAGGHTTPSGECHSATPPPPHPQPPSPTPAPPTQLAPLSKLPAAVTPDAPAARQPSVPLPHLRGAHASQSCNPPRRHRGLGSTPSGGQNGDPPPRPATDRRGGGPRRARKRPSGP